jgi:hypothetical protein
MPLPTPLHLGALHPCEQLLVLLVAFGPFVVLGVVVAVQRRRAVAEEQAEELAQEQAHRQATGPVERSDPETGSG